ncbi:GreA/GreB family elongation factor [Saccharothrix longispora]|uniref:GreA/GreB family elongation factor n=1 Tax=Saccharothrix longispora TaxID=33920 RepID=UPI0028FDA706|nr:GreA/GreB family elongation factor [Saccharothrix longispora]MDU0288205.1 GreA/GreB family elongation factor [Saccharothrix longispora]
MTSTHPGTRRVWLSPDAHQRLRAELAGLLAAGAAPAHDGTGADEERGAVPRRQREERIREIQELLNVAVVGQDPPDDGVAELGMVLTVRYDDTGDVETFLLGLRAVEHGDVEVYSPDSPLGAALTGARPGDQRTYRAPNGNSIRVTLLDAVPHGHHRSAGAS